ncbi:hypothetical protein [Pseudonocardia sp. WMMC193]|uniref:hypothetical protein n=1 Tax=Pseudonocardia sp. WMMC193 TaxID=2911965 RepID=UPI001F3AE7BF|nr:hypothetical protein [Pseudonocardia sp. WMMC193]MCF7548073.1 hypothetical protein [Pseudonocardia sp. WMMC193]
MLRLVAAVLLVILAFSLVGAVFEFVAWALVVGAVVFGGVVVWSKLSGDGPRTRERDSGISR